jgi:hypothetical protein
MEFSSHYDFVLLGEHPAGLWAALRLLELEKKVLILPLGRDSGLNAAPKAVIRDFGWKDSEWLDRGSQPIQIITPNRRFRVEGNPEDLETEYEFQFGQKPAGNPSYEILRGLAYFARGSEAGPVFAEDWKLWVQRALDTVYLEKESGFLVKSMLRHLSERGAHISRSEQLKQVFVDKKTLVGVQLEGASKMISTVSGLICSNYDLVKGYLNESLPSLSEPMGWTFEMKFECAPSSLPAGLTRRMAYVESGAPILEIIQQTSGYFQLRTPLPISEESLSRPFQRRLCERMIKVCERIIPDLEYNLRQVVPDLRDPEKTESVDLPRLYPFEDPHRIPLSKVFYGASRSLGHQSAIQNLFIVSEESYPGVGLRGAYQAALQVFESLNKRDQVNHYLSSSHLNEFR